MTVFNPTLWVVDDDPADHALFKVALRRSSFDHAFSSYHSAEEALSALDEGHRPSLILLDLNMPGTGGLGFLRARQRRSLMSIPVLVFTSSSNPDDIHATYELGANSFVRKPDNLDAYLDFVATMMRFWLKWAILPRGMA